MKKTILLNVFMVLLCAWNIAIAAETEPNNTKAQANTLALNGNNNGAIGAGTDVDWWKVTTTADGRLNISITVSNGLYLWCQIYDNDGITKLAEEYTDGTNITERDGLAAGTYYIKLFPFYDGQKPVYAISNTLNVPSQANDAEPNGTKALAKELPLNGKKTGHINYYYNGAKDGEDWYKVTTNEDGRLRLTMASANSKYVWVYLYDNNGTTELASGYTNGTAAVVDADGLAAGTYYVKVKTFYDNDFAPYSLSDSLFSPAESNNVEPDSTRALAAELPLNGSKQGHINYYYNNHRDSADWYRVTTNADGRLRLTMKSGNGRYVWAYLYDNNGTTEIASGNTDGTAYVVNKDGLAAGTYYVKIKTFYNDHFAPYTLSDSLFTPTEANDIEPNDSRAQALVLPLNGKKTGHINYYYNNHKDSTDWYKVTTNADGRLRLTVKSGNGQNVWAYLYDNDGITELKAGYTSGNAVVVDKDGLAAGTYYIRVNTFYTNEWAPYTLSDSLFKPDQANDTEPNNSRTEAVTLPANGSVTGHTNYYYKKVKDTADWYKLTTTSDGMITINIQSHNGQNVWAYLYDNDGTTEIAKSYTSGSTSYSFDGLKAGTYYIRVNVYYADAEWAPYTLSNTLSYYSFKDDVEPNNSFSKAKTLLSNKTGTGHVNFYYKGSSDEVDYHKINYTGTGNLTLLFTQQNRFKYGSAEATWFQVYKDTNAAPISSGYYYSSSGDINLTGLAQGYYYIKVATYYNGRGEHFSSYSIKNTFTQVNRAKIVTQSYAASSGCDSNGTITYKLSKSHAPYKVQLYRFGTPYGDPLIVNKTTAVFNDLPAGIYHATVYGDGATDPARGISDTVTFNPPVPAGLNTTAIQATQAKLNWTVQTCADYFSIQYRVQGTTAWTTKKTTGNVAFYTLKNLAASTSYQWRVAAVDTGNGMQVISAYSAITTFKTKASALSGDDEAESMKIAGNDLNNASIVVAPNPATNYFTIKYKAAVKGKVTATLFGANGKPVWTSGALNAEALNNKQVNVSQFAGGSYFLKITDGNGNDAGTTKIFIVK